MDSHNQPTLMSHPGEDLDLPFSQNKEEEHILNYFGDYVGRLVDIGANNGLTFSNSLALFHKGWSGVCVEPSPDAYAELCKTHASRPDVKCIHAAVGTESGFVTLHDSRDSLISTIDPNHKDLFPSDYNEVPVACWTWRDLLLFHPGPYDFITIDAEGMDWLILQQIDLSEVKLICVEHGNTHYEEMVRYCMGYGMKVIYSCYENVIMGK